ncbi:MAG: hypothetical protein ACXVPM_04410, partial [Bacteroidia bacterium]
MKKIITTIVLSLSIAAAGIAQTTPTKKAEDENTNSCYSKWAQKFQDRGAEDVADGSYTDVIISIRSGA